MWLFIQGKEGINQVSSQSENNAVKYKNITEDKTQNGSGLILVSNGEAEKVFNRKVDI